MRRTIGTIVGDGQGAGIVRLIHDDNIRALISVTAQGEENIVNAQPLRTPLAARRFARDSWGTSAVHDSWVLCLRPVAALRMCRSEAQPE